jgi:hypothetical protein
VNADLMLAAWVAAHGLLFGVVIARRVLRSVGGF